MKKLLVLLLCLISASAMATSVFDLPKATSSRPTGSIVGYYPASGTYYVFPINSSGELPVSINASYTGDVNLFTKPANLIATQTITLTANVSQEITCGLASGIHRKFIVLTTIEPNKRFHVQFNSAAVIGSASPYLEQVSLPFDREVVVNVISSETIDLNVIEGGVE